jgi:uncharacterized RmlC-like cupin family protein
MTDAVEVLKDEQLQDAVGTPGITRRVAFEADGHWFGHVEAAPAAMSGWHHHGDNETLGYVIDGEIRVEFGPGGSQSLEAGTGDYFRVPPNLIHREGNMSTRPGSVVLVRVGQGPPVFPADGPEPADDEVS